MRWLLRIRKNKLLKDNVFKTFVNVQLTERKGGRPRVLVSLSPSSCSILANAEMGGRGGRGSPWKVRAPKKILLVHLFCVPGAQARRTGGRWKIFPQGILQPLLPTEQQGGGNGSKGDWWKKSRGGLPRKGRRGGRAIFNSDAQEGVRGYISNSFFQPWNARCTRINPSPSSPWEEIRIWLGGIPTRFFLVGKSEA